MGAAPSLQVRRHLTHEIIAFWRACLQIHKAGFVPRKGDVLIIVAETSEPLAPDPLGAQSAGVLEERFRLRKQLARDGLLVLVPPTPVLMDSFRPREFRHL